MTIEIIGSNLDKSFEHFNIKATKTYETEPDWLDISLQTWELSKEEFQRYCDIPDSEWINEDHGWWAYGGSNFSKDDLSTIVIDGKEVLAFKMYTTSFDYENLVDYFDSHLGISKYNNYAYVIQDLAEYNHLTKAEFMKLYW